MSLALVKIEGILTKLRLLDKEIANLCMRSSSYIARQDEARSFCTVKVVSLYLGISSASASRNVAMLSDWNRHDKPGFGLVEKWENPKYRIEKLIRLTPKGKLFIESLEEEMNNFQPTVYSKEDEYTSKDCYTRSI